MTVQQMEQLRALLQLLALPVTGQMRLIPEECRRLEQLASTLRGWRQALPVELATTLSPGQEQVLLRLEHHLTRICEEPTSPLRTDTAMRQSEGLRQARWLAREALVHFGWPLVLPAGELTQILSLTQF